MDWADVNGCPDGLVGGDATKNAYRLFANDVEDRVRRHEFESSHAFRLQTIVLTVLEALTSISDLGKGIRFIRDTSHNKGGTEPAAQHDFAHALALNDSLFQGFVRSRTWQSTLSISSWRCQNHWNGRMISCGLFQPPVGFSHLINGGRRERSLIVPIGTTTYEQGRACNSR
jgi:hypothetical protein